MSLFAKATGTEAAALRILQNTFGYPDFVGLQREVIAHIADGGDALALMPTGGGKSLCYQIPALLRKGTAVVVSPLIALMKDQVDALQQNDVRAAFLNSTQTAKQAAAVEDMFARGELDLLYIAPERLMTERGMQALNRGQVALFAIDEAHCVSQWGHDFRPEYLKLGRLTTAFPNAPMLALTATADVRTRLEIADKLRLKNGKTFIASFDRPNICFSIARRDNARRQLLDFYQQHHRGHAGIVYCLSRRKTEETAAFLEQQGLRALPYHAGMDAKTRQRHQDIFINEEDTIIAATIAFGMGINKPDVRFVAHLDMPKSIEGYYQEVGRAGRDGLPANALLLYGLGDAKMLRQMIDEGNAPAQVRRLQHQKMEALLALCVSTACRRQSLLAYFDESFTPPCNNCDNCLQPPQMWDGGEAAKKFLSCVYRSGERFGAGHVIDVLLGKDTERMQKFSHHTLSTFNIGGELNNKEWRAVARQLVATGTLSAGEHGELKLTEEAWKIMRGQQAVAFRRELPPPSRAKKSATKAADKSPPPSIDLDERQTEIFNALRELRLKLAQQQNVPAYVIFHDRVLAEMARTHPTNTEELRGIGGMGAAKMERYAAKFLKVLRDV